MADIVLVDVPMTGGLNQGVDSRLVQPGQMLEAENAVQDRRGAWRKRSGYNDLTLDKYPSGTLSAPKRVHQFNSEIVSVGRTDGLDRISCYSPNQNKWGEQDFVPSLVTRRSPVASQQKSVFSPRYALVPGYDCYAWLDLDDGILFKILDANTGTTIVPETIIAAGTGLSLVQVISVGPYAVVLYRVTAASDLVVYVFNTSTLVGATNTLYTGTFFGFADACAADGTQFFVAFGTAANQYRLSLVNAATLAIVATATQAVNTLANVVLNANSSGDVWVGDLDSGTATASVTAWSRDLSSNTVARTTVFNTIVSNTHLSICKNGTDLIVAFGGQFTAGEDAVWIQKLDATGAGVGAVQRSHRCWLAAHLFLHNSRVYALVDFEIQGDAASSAVLCVDARISATARELLLVGHCLERNSVATFLPGFGNPLPHPAQFATEQWRVVHHTADGIVGYAISHLALEALTFDFAGSELYLDNQAQACLQTAGSLLTHFDGQSLVETGFIQPPLVEEVSKGTTGAMLNGSYLYTVVYEWRDAKGNLHQSAPSDYLTVDMTGTDDEVTLRLWHTSLTLRGDTENGAGRVVSLALYRTTASGKIFYRITPKTGAFAVLLVNDRVTNPSQTYTDAISDNDLLALGYGKLYTDGGIRENTAPPSSRALVPHRNRVWIASNEDPREVWYSKLQIKGEAPAFAAAFKLRLDDASEEVTALASLDESLLIFTRSRIYYVQGDGPADNGVGGVFTDPLPIAVADGCTDARSVVRFPHGVVFLGTSGFWRVDSALRAEFLGEAVRDLVTSYPTCVRARLDGPNQRLLFLMQNAAGTSAIFLVFDYNHAVWSHWALPAGSQPVRDHVLWGAYHVLASASAVQISPWGANPGMDAGTAWVTTKLTTAWVHVAGLNGYQTVQKVTVNLRRRSAVNLVCKVYVNYSETVAQTETFTALADKPQWDFRLNSEALRCSAIKLEFSDTTPGTVTEQVTGIELVGATLEVALEPQAHRLPATERHLWFCRFWQVQELR